MSEPTARPWARYPGGVLVDGVRMGQVGVRLVLSDAPVDVALSEAGIEITALADRGTFPVAVTISRSDALALSDALLELVRQ